MIELPTALIAGTPWRNDSPEPEMVPPNNSNVPIFLLCAVCAAYLCVADTAAAETPFIGALAPPKQEYRAETDRRDWSAAVREAQMLVAEARLDPTQTLALADALSRLGTVQLRSADIAGAEATFAEALKLVERHHGSASSHTLAPLRGLGFSFAESGRHAQAIPYLDRALLIAHRTHGLFHPEQLSILRQLSRSLTLAGAPLEAERHVNYMLRVGEHVYGKNDPDIVALKCAVADWHAQTGDFDFARRHYREAIEIVEKRLGERSVALVTPLRRIAWSHIFEMEFELNGYIDPRDDELPISSLKPPNPRYINPDGLRALKRALLVLESAPDAPRQLTIDTLIDVGDWYQIRDDSEEALHYYSRAAELIFTDEADSAEAAHNPLAVPVRVYYPVPDVISRGNKLHPHESEEAYVQMELTVSAEGSVEEAKVIDESSSERQANEILGAIRDARFRPRFVDGVPVETKAMSFRQVLRVRKRADDEPS